MSSPLVRYPGPGCIVEFLQGNQEQLAIVLEEQSGKLRLYTSAKRETKLPASRLLPWSGPQYDPGLSRAAMDERLAMHHEARRAAAEAVDAVALWELAQGEVEKARAEWFAELLWEHPDVDRIAGTGHALLAAKTHYKFQPPDFQVLAAERVEARLAERENAEQREKLVAQGHSFLKDLWQGSDPATLKAPDPEAAASLKSVLLARIADPEDRETDAVWKDLKRGLPDLPFLPLILAERWGIVDQHHNYLLDRADYAWGDEWSAAHADQIHELAQRVRELEHAFEATPFVSIDSSTTRDIDDAFHIERLPGSGYRLQVALACPAAHWPFGSPLDRAVFDRATSIYLPEGSAHMMPEALSCGLYSLLEGKARPAVVLDAELTEDGALSCFDFRPAVVRLAANISYDAAEAAIEAGSSPELSGAADLSVKLRDRRIERGAVVIEREEPEIELTSEPAGNGQASEIRVELAQKPLTPRAQLLVSELMILANECAALWAGERGVPLLYRTQDVTLPKDAAGIWTTPEDIFRVVKHFGPTLLETCPRPHKGLGLAAYSPVTSPLRRYPDLINMAQISGVLRDGAPVFDAEALAHILPSLCGRLDAAGQVQRFRPRYWKLLYVRQHRKTRPWTGVAIDESGGFVTLSLPDVQIFVRVPRDMLGEKIYPGQRFDIRFGRVDPLANEIRVNEAIELEDDGGLEM